MDKVGDSENKVRAEQASIQIYKCKRKAFMDGEFTLRHECDTPEEASHFLMGEFGSGYNGCHMHSRALRNPESKKLEVYINRVRCKQECVKNDVITLLDRLFLIR